MNLFDTHAHLDDEQLIEQTEPILKDCQDHGVSRILTVSTNLDSCHRSIQIAEQHSEVYAAVGIHPNYCHQAGPTDWQTVESLVPHTKVVAIGETGLDDHWDYCPMDVQIDFFLKHIELSHQTGLPFIVHMRDCEPLMLQTLESALDPQGRLNGIMHSFCGSLAAANQCLEWGMHISFAGMVTYKKNQGLREIARTIPDDRLLIETDSPYLSPHPCRSQRPNTPALIRHTLQCLAEVRGVTTDHLAKITTDNALRLLKGTA